MPPVLAIIGQSRPVVKTQSGIRLEESTDAGEKNCIADLDLPVP
jgi:hypothetical protein